MIMMYVINIKGYVYTYKNIAYIAGVRYCNILSIYIYIILELSNKMPDRMSTRMPHDGMPTGG